MLIFFLWLNISKWLLEHYILTQLGINDAYQLKHSIWVSMMCTSGTLTMPSVMLLDLSVWHVLWVSMMCTSGTFTMPSVMLLDLSVWHVLWVSRYTNSAIMSIGSINEVCIPSQYDIWVIIKKVTFLVCQKKQIEMTAKCFFLYDNCVTENIENLKSWKCNLKDSLLENYQMYIPGCLL